MSGTVVSTMSAAGPSAVRQCFQEWFIFNDLVRKFSKSLSFYKLKKLILERIHSTFIPVFRTLFLVA